MNYKIEISDVSSTLKINKIDLNDVGNYTCVAKNTFGSDSQTVFLNIKGMFLICNHWLLIIINWKILFFKLL